LRGFVKDLVIALGASREGLMLRLVLLFVLWSAPVAAEGLCNGRYTAADEMLDAA